MPTDSTLKAAAAAWLCAIGCACLAGCGSVGEPLYPALNIPTRIGDLTAVERGDKIDIHFTIPPQTTEGLVLKTIGSLEVRVGPNPSGAPFDAWAAGAKQIDVPLPVQPGAVQATASAQEFIGKEVVIAARVGNSKGRMSAWSNVVVVNIEQPLATPSDLQAEGVPEGVRLTWSAPNQNAFRIYRKVAPEKEPSLLDTADKPEYLDTNTEYGKTYEYYVQAIHDKTESDVVGPKSLTTQDKFPPRVPTGLTASIGIGAIELAWDRNTEADFKQYRVYRSEGEAPFVQIAEGLEAPIYSDRKIESGKQYRYRVAAADQTNNESKPSEPVAATAP
jgi:fibronectin type 3 domain-containing protein